MRRTFALCAAVALLALVLGSLAAWRVEAGDDASPVPARLSAIEARLVAIEKRLAALEGPAAQAALPAPTRARPKDAAALRALRTNAAFQDMSVTTILRAIAATHDLNVVTSPDAGKQGDATRVTLHVADGTLGELLDTIASKAGLVWTVEDHGILRITAASER